MRSLPAFLLGAVLGPLFGSAIRPLLRETLKGGLLIAREVRKIAEEVREEVEDIHAEASAQIDHKHKPS